MAEVYDVGTPVRGERKYRRMRSPLQEMDGMPLDGVFMRQPEFDVEPKTPEVPTTSKGASEEGDQ